MIERRRTGISQPFGVAYMQFEVKNLKNGNLSCSFPEKKRPALSLSQKKVDGEIFAPQKTIIIYGRAMITLGVMMTPIIC